VDAGGAYGAGENGVVADEKTDAAAAAEVGQVARQIDPVRRLVVAQDDRRSARQGGDRRPRVGQPGAVGHQDERRQAPGVVSGRQIEPPREVC
jgi:hypothetical protein